MRPPAPPVLSLAHPRLPPRSNDDRGLLGNLDLQLLIWKEPPTTSKREEQGCPQQKAAKGYRAETSIRAPCDCLAAAAAAANARAAAASVTPNRSPQGPMTSAAQGDPPPPPLLGPVLGILPAYLFQQEVLRRLNPTDIASLAEAGRGCAAAVAATVLMQWANARRSHTLCAAGTNSHHCV